MLVKKIKWTDWDGNEREQEFFFNFTQTELTELELSASGGMMKNIQKIIDTQDHPTLIKLWKEIILASYGEKSADGYRFEKSEELSRAFSETGAFDILFMELATDATAAQNFIEGIIPQTE